MTKYSVMTYNDGDNVTTKADQIAAIIKAYDPDLFGLQEVQEKHSVYYAEALGTYNYAYFDNDGTTFNSQPIYYKKDKFELLASGIKWISDTPNVRSKYDISAYTRSFTYVYLKDKATKEQFLMVNTHIDYVDAANQLQVARIIELTREMYPDTPIFYIADWNMNNTQRGYAVMGEHGMKATEEFLPDANKCGTMIGSDWAIDFCFVDTKYWKGVDYKVVTDHEYSKTASDHYPVYTEIERI